MKAKLLILSIICVLMAVLPGAAGKNIKHPSLLFTPERVAAAKKAAASDSVCAAAVRGILERADAVVAKPDVMKMEYPALAWQWTGDRKYADTPGQLLEHNDIVLNLNPVCRIADAEEWVKPGTIMRETTISTEGAIRTLDFCAEHIIPYMLFDWLWYLPCTSHDGDATKWWTSSTCPAWWSTPASAA